MFAVLINCFHAPRAPDFASAISQPDPFLSAYYYLHVNWVIEMVTDAIFVKKGTKKYFKLVLTVGST